MNELLGESPVIEQVRTRLRRLVDHRRAGQRLPPVLLLGESGTGKGLFARLLHRYGPRSHAPFVDVNCAAIPDTLLEAELFGFEQGAFTDARRAKPGLFQTAHRGMLFLDEIALCPDAAQAKLLTALEDGTIRRLGSTRAENTDIWFVAATNANLAEAVRTRRFREDLYHRLAVFTVDIPPLRARGRDVVILAERILARVCENYGLPAKRLDETAERRLLEYSWPGNVRELNNVIERAALMWDSPLLTADSLEPLRSDEAGALAAENLSTIATSKDEARRHDLLMVLHEVGWNLSLAAARLRIARNTVYARMKKYGLRPGAASPTPPEPQSTHSPGPNSSPATGVATFESSQTDQCSAASALAVAKILPPTATGSMPRPRLFRRLDRARARPLTWIWGPPGSGKTTLAASYRTSRGLRHLWYRVDETDEDVATFFYYLGRAAPGGHTPLPVFAPEYRRGLASFTRRFFRALYERLPAPFAIVLDNYQTVSDRAQLHEVVREAVDELPVDGRMIVVSRQAPPAALARLYASQGIDVVAWSELRLTPDEAARLVRGLGGQRWPRAAINSVYAEADGWAAGVILLLERLRARGAEAFLRPAGPEQAVFDYFASEVFARADETTQHVLLRTALVPTVTASIAEKLSGYAAAGRILDDLHREHYFTSKQEHGDESVYQYHPLFRGFLQARAEAALGPAALRDLRCLAAGLVESAGDAATAYALLRDAEDWAGLADLAARQAPFLASQGRNPTVVQWINGLPLAIIDERPWLLYWRGVCQLVWRPTESERDLSRAFNGFRRERDTAGTILTWSALMTTYESLSRHPGMDPWIALLDDILREASAVRSEEIEMRLAGGILMSTFRDPSRPDAERWAARALDLSRHHPDLVWRAIIAFNWFAYHLQFGRFAMAGEVVDEMRTLMRASDTSALVAVCAGMTVVSHEALTADPAYRETLETVVDIARSAGLPFTAKVAALIGGLYGALSDGQTVMYTRWLAELERDVATVGPGQYCQYLQCVVRAALLRGDVEGADRHRQELLRMSAAGGWLFDKAVALLLVAQVAAKSGDLAAADEHLREALAIGSALRSPYVEFMARLTEAEICFGAGRDADGERALGIGFALGRAGGYVNSHVWSSLVMSRLCRRALDAGLEVEYVHDLTRRRNLAIDATDR